MGLRGEIWEREFTMPGLDIGLGYLIFATFGNLVLTSRSGDCVVFKLTSIIAI